MNPISDRDLNAIELLARTADSPRDPEFREVATPATVWSLVVRLRQAEERIKELEAKLSAMSN